MIFMLGLFSRLGATVEGFRVRPLRLCFWTLVLVVAYFGRDGVR